MHPSLRLCADLLRCVTRDGLLISPMVGNAPIIVNINIHISYYY